jgi:hypothetical protein
MDKVLIDAEALKKYEESLHSKKMQCSQCDIARQVLAVAKGHAVTWKDGKVSFT